MTGSPADLLAAARNNPVGPYMPAKEEWLKGWTGPVEYRNSLGEWEMLPCIDGRFAGAGVLMDIDRIRLDTRRREVQHLLCDLGIAPEWTRKSAVACWCAGMGVVPIGTMPLWARNSALHNFERVGPLTSTLTPTGWSIVRHRTGDPRPLAKGPETGALGRACADIAALRARCILTEPTGLYVPLADGGIGWWENG